MGEIAINPTHNVHKNYRKVNLVNPYIFAPPAPVYNTEIGGVASTITTASALATKLGISVGAISNFTIVGSDIKCKITGSYVIPNLAFNNSNIMTFYKDGDLVTSMGDCFFGQTNVKEFYFKNATSIGGLHTFYNTNADVYYLPNCVYYGDPAVNNDHFYGTKSNKKIYAHPSMATINSGGVESDLAYAISLGATVRYVTNFTAPNQITDLAAGAIYNTVVQLNFTPPTGSTNAIDYYELYKDGVLQTQKITASGQYLAGLTDFTSYNITLVAVDVFYNKSVVSNSLSVSTNTTAAPPNTIPGLVSYYKLDSNSNDSFGSNNGTNTSVSYVGGKVNNAASFNGTSSKISTPNNSFDYFGTQNFSYSMWIKPLVMPASGKFSNLITVEENGTPLTRDKAVRLYSDGKLSFYGYDGAEKIAYTSVGLITVSNWYYVTAVYNGVNLKLYVDGVLKITLACSSTFNFTVPKITFSQFASAGTDVYYNGLIDEVAIYNVALTQSQIDSLYNLGNGITL